MKYPSRSFQDALHFANSADAVLPSGQVITILNPKCFVQAASSNLSAANIQNQCLPACAESSSRRPRKLVAIGRTAADVVPGMNLRFESDILPLDWNAKAISFHVDHVQPLEGSLIPFKEFSASVNLDDSESKCDIKALLDLLPPLPSQHGHEYQPSSS